MLVKQEQISPCEVALEIEVDAEKVKSAFDDTYTELGKATNVPGFRKGKAPRIVLEQYLDPEKVKDRAVGKLMKGAFSEALEESKLKPFAPADVEVIKFDTGEPMRFKATVPLPPKVELGDYVGIEVERKIEHVTDEDVEAEIQRMLERRADYTFITDRGARATDRVVVEMKNLGDPDSEPRRNVTELGGNLPDFDKGVIGMKIDEEKAIEITYPDDFSEESMRGKTVGWRTKLIEIEEKHVPKLTDEWVKATFVRETEEDEEPAPDAIDTVDKMRARFRSAMEKAALDAAEAEVRDKIVDQVVKNATVSFPDVMVDEAVEERVDDLLKYLKQRKVTLEDYLNYVAKSEEELRKQYEEESKRILALSLVFREIIDKEGIEVEDDDVKAEIRAMADEKGVPPETMTAYLDKTEGMPAVRNRVLRKKTVDFLVHASNITDVGN